MFYTIINFSSELKETVARMGADLKQRVFDSVRSTWNSVYQLASFHRNNESLTEEMNKVWIVLNWIRCWLVPFYLFLLT